MKRNMTAQARALWLAEKPWRAFVVVFTGDPKLYFYSGRTRDEAEYHACRDRSAYFEKPIQLASVKVARRAQLFDDMAYTLSSRYAMPVPIRLAEIADNGLRLINWDLPTSPEPEREFLWDSYPFTNAFANDVLVHYRSLAESEGIISAPEDQKAVERGLGEGIDYPGDNPTPNCKPMEPCKMVPVRELDELEEFVQNGRALIPAEPISPEMAKALEEQFGEPTTTRNPDGTYTHTYAGATDVQHLTFDLYPEEEERKGEGQSDGSEIVRAAAIFVGLILIALILGIVFGGGPIR